MTLIVLTKTRNFDGWCMYLTDKIKNWLDNLVFDSILVTREQHNGFTVAKILIEKHWKPVYIRYLDERVQRRVQFYIRGINGKEQLDTKNTRTT
ncbi:MAG: hypothetical protein WAM14_27420 [Candidatus Nitrosopolaris sp.]